ncbi:hypothetical protein FQA39_LY03701 [Lamprigera yunnana]|nr:hypothetical protein FQA39_LY03701 [Lamprigera yunnana]
MYLISIGFFLTLSLNCVFAQFLECSNNKDCVAEDAICDKNLCWCPNDKVYSTDGTECLSLGLSVGAACIEDQQCSWLLGQYECANETCRCSKNWFYYKGRCRKASKVKNSCSSNDFCFNGYDPLAMICKDEVCQCNEGYYLRGEYDCRPISGDGEYCSLHSDCSQGSNLCVNSLCLDSTIVQEKSEIDISNFEQADDKLEKAELNLDCTKDEECLAVKNSVCNLHVGKCICERSYQYNPTENQCAPELGTFSNCKRDKDCPIKYSVCNNGICACRKTYFTVNDGTACQKPMTHDNLFCNTKERCYVLGLDGVCDQNKCKCISGEYNKDFVCEVKSCKVNSDCGVLENSECVENVCQCMENFQLENGRCLPNLGSPCSETSPCITANSTCSDDICSCKEGSLAVENVCLEKVTNLNGTCVNSKQCIVSESECRDSKCTCLNGYADILGDCVEIKKMGNICGDTLQCRMFLSGNVTCRNGYCRCPVGLIMTPKGDGCESSANLLSKSNFIMISLLILNFTRYYF